MSGFIAGAPAAAGLISSDPFWPGIDLDELRSTLRIDSSVSLARLETAVVAAIINVNRELSAWRLGKQVEGIAALVDVPGEKIQNKSEYEHLYLRAVQAAAGAEVCERYRGYDTTASGSKNADEITPTIDDYRRDQRWAIRDFLGKSRTTVELL